MRFKKHLRPWMLVSAAWIVPAVFAVINRIAQERLTGWGPVTARDLIWEGGDWLLYGFLTPGVFGISKRWPLIRPHLRSRILFHLAMSLLFCIAWATAGKVLQLLLAVIFEPRMIAKATETSAAQLGAIAGLDLLSWIFITLPFGVAVYLCVVGIEHASRYFIEARERDVQLARLSEQLADARFSALQSQVNPHFLFNTLNTIGVLVRDNDRQAAVRILEQLSDVLRTTLSSHQSNEVTLGEELELVRQYVAIEQARFSDRLHPEFNVDASLLAAVVPSFAVQHLVENAIRHGIAKGPDAGQLIVSARRDGEVLEITVTDDGPGIDPQMVPPRGHGIQNTRERLHALYGERTSLEIVRRAAGGTMATLRIPYHELSARQNSET